MHDHQLGARLRRDARCPAHQRLRLRSAGDGDDDAFARFPGVGDLVVVAVLLQRRVDLVGEPQQRQLAQRGQVALAEVVGQRGVDPLGRVDVAVGEPAPQRFRRDVDELDLVGRADDLVGHLLLLLDAGDLGDDVVEALEVLDVDGRDDGDAGVEQLLDVLPAFGVLAARGVGVGELVDEHHLWLALQHRLDVELGELAAAVLDVLAAGIISMPAIRSAVFLRPCVSTTAATTSVPRSSRRWASPSIAKVLPTPGAAPR